MSDQKILSPLPGTFYRKPSPDAPPFVKEGDAVTPQTVIGMIELMKQFTEVEAGVTGTLVSFDAEDGAFVDSDEPLATVAASS